uniref:Uncharacterized protein n=1 Tax=Caenorhabditis japonica TaxID=281687 RepID=A0A8R1E4M5_CAEJA
MPGVFPYSQPDTKTTTGLAGHTTPPPLPSFFPSVLPISSVATSSTTVIPVLSIRKGHELIGHLEDYLFWPYTFQSTILLVLFIVWIRKPVQNKFFNGAYSVKKKRYVKDKNYEAVANGGNEIV